MAFESIGISASSVLRRVEASHFAYAQDAISVRVDALKFRQFGLHNFFEREIAAAIRIKALECTRWCFRKLGSCQLMIPVSILAGEGGGDIPCEFGLVDDAFAVLIGRDETDPAEPCNRFTIRRAIGLGGRRRRGRTGRALVSAGCTGGSGYGKTHGEASAGEKEGHRDISHLFAARAAAVDSERQRRRCLGLPRIADAWNPHNAFANPGMCTW
jgi:hypothetical protein